MVRTFIPEEYRDRLGIDALTITPAIEDGYMIAIVINDQKTKQNKQLSTLVKSTIRYLQRMPYYIICVHLVYLKRSSVTRERLF